jgi:glycosyltransferase involved in cell wall biosynthesis
MTDPPQISVALVTRNRPESLERTLASLVAQDHAFHEIVVSDDSDTEIDRVREVTRGFGARYIAGPRRGLYANRNHAALACQGSHVRTMDDDHEFPPGHVARCIEAVERDAGAVWIIGEVIPGDPRMQDGFRSPPQLHPRGFSLPPPNMSRIWAIADGATIYPRAIFAAGHRFEDSFPFGASYLEWGSRLGWLGYDIRHLDTTYVIHHFEAQTRSIQSEDVELSARFFAMLCHSFIYQPTLRNRFLTSAEIARRLIQRRSVAIRSLRAARLAYRRRAALGRGPDTRVGE